LHGGAGIHGIYKQRQRQSPQGGDREKYGHCPFCHVRVKASGRQAGRMMRASLAAEESFDTPTGRIAAAPGLLCALDLPLVTGVGVVKPAPGPSPDSRIVGIHALAD
jgi:hypothetical protein